VMEKHYGERMKIKDEVGDAIWTHVWKLMWNDIFGTRKSTRRCVLHELSVVNKAKRVADGRRLLQALRNEQSQNFAHIMTEQKSWF
jgi:hypothetical protein